MPIDKDLWQRSRSTGSGENSSSIEASIHPANQPTAPQQPIINLNVNTSTQPSSEMTTSSTDSSSRELEEIKASLRDLGERLSDVKQRSVEPANTEVQPNYIVLNPGSTEKTVIRKKWPAYAAAVLLVGGLVVYAKRDEIQDAACERSADFCHEDELANRVSEIEGIPQESDIGQNNGGYQSNGPNMPDTQNDGTASGNQNSTPRYVPPQDPAWGDGEFAPGLPQDLSDRPILIANPADTVNQQTDTASPVINGANYLLKLTEEGLLVPDTETFVEWSTLEMDPSGQAFKIRVREIENNRYLSDQSFGRFMNSESLTDEELLQFLYENEIISANVSRLYVEFVGEDDSSVFRTLTVGSGG